MAKKTPKQLVDGAVGQARKNALNSLSSEDRGYVIAVAAEAKHTPGVQIYRVADALISELSLNIHQHTMVRILKGLMNAKA